VVGTPLDAILAVVRTTRDRRAIREAALRVEGTPLVLLDASCVGIRSTEEAAVLP